MNRLAVVMKLPIIADERFKPWDIDHRPHVEFCKTLPPDIRALIFGGSFAVNAYCSCHLRGLESKARIMGCNSYGSCR